MSDLTTLRFTVTLPPKDVPDASVRTRTWDPDSEREVIGRLAEDALRIESLPADWGQTEDFDPAGVFVALHPESGDPVGFATCRKGEHTGDIDMVAVSHGFRRKGAGTALLQAALAYLVSRGAEKAQADIPPANRAAMALFRHHGFEAS